MKTIIVIITLALITSFTAFGQHSGNSAINQSYNSSSIKYQGLEKLYLSDSTFIVQGNVLMNVIADNYVANFGVSESDKSLKEANNKIDKRIQNFILALTKMGIPSKDIYVDITTLTQIADYKANGNYMEQFISGFEQKKNVIVKFNNIKDLDKMIIIATDYEIYDLAKIDYNVASINKIYNQLFQNALEVINNKKELYCKATNVKLIPSSQIYGESLYSLYPSQLYKNYTPNVSTEYSDYSSYSKKKNLMKNTTYYYDKINYSGFDNIINPVVTEPAIEFILMLQIKYQIENNK
jgi:uncharacterized protein YggE